MRFPVHRSLLFWFGLFGVVFLMWVSADSFWKTSQLYFPGGSCGSRIIFSDGLVGLRIDPDLPPSSWELVRHGSLPGPRFPMPVIGKFYNDMVVSGVHTYCIVVALPCWLMLAIYLPVWTLLLRLRAQKYRAADEMKMATSPLP
jgi:hypothetical protein